MTTPGVAGDPIANNSPQEDVRPSPGAFAPLARPTFRSLWLGALLSNVGDWMENVGSAWLMTELSHSATLVGLVQTTSSLPFVLFALPAGALADIVDRRKLLIVTQVASVAVLGLLAALTALGVMSPPLLLLFTFGIGSLAAAALPTWQAIVPDLVPRDELRSAIALNGAAINVARAIGPAIAGLLIAVIGVAAVFAGNAVAFLMVVVVVAGWQSAPKASAAPAERLVGATRAGLRYARESLELRAVLVRTVLFTLPASAVWALLPLVARARFGADGGLAYGVLVGFLGAGAVGAIALMPRLRARFSNDQLIVGGSVVFGTTLVVLGAADSPAVLAGVAILGGVAWLIVVTSLNVATQFRLPDWIRARGLATYQIAFQGCLALGGLIWGALADAAGVEGALAVAGAAALLGTLGGTRWSLASGEALDLHPAALWPAPNVARVPEPEEGPVLVQVTYRIDPAQANAFSREAANLGRLRRRDGASRWLLFEDVAEPGRYVESFLVESWAEHLRQHARVTEADRQVEERVLGYQTADVPVEARHLVAREGD